MFLCSMICLLMMDLLLSLYSCLIFQPSSHSPPTAVAHHKEGAPPIAPPVAPPVAGIDDKAHQALLARYPPGHPNHQDVNKMYAAAYYAAAAAASSTPTTTTTSISSSQHTPLSSSSSTTTTEPAAQQAGGQQAGGQQAGGQQANFNLYGYQPPYDSQQQHYISLDKLPAAVSPNTHQQQQYKQSVIVSNKPKDLSSPLPAREGSITHGTARHPPASSASQLSPGVAARQNYLPPPPPQSSSASSSHKSPHHHSQISPPIKRPHQQLEVAAAGVARKKSRPSDPQISPSSISSPPHQSPLTSPKSTSSSSQSSAAAAAAASNSSSYIDSFRSFVENAVQSAFYQDPQLGSHGSHAQLSQLYAKGKLHQTTTSSSSSATSAPPVSSAAAAAIPPSTASLMAAAAAAANYQHPPHQQKAVSTSTTNSSSSSVLTSSAPVSQHQQQQQQRPGPASTPASSVSSISSLQDTSVNQRVNLANGVTGDVDSDTLSAPSPPTHVRDNTASPHPCVKHTKAHKKAWLQRYTDDNTDKQQTSTLPSSTPPSSTASNSTAPSSTASSTAPSSTAPPSLAAEQETIKAENTAAVGAGDKMKDCYVNCSYISPKDSNSSSSISKSVAVKKEDDHEQVARPSSAAQLTAVPPHMSALVRKEDESTTSASEAEAHSNEDKQPSKKKNKRKNRHRSNSPMIDQTNNKPSAPKKPKLEELKTEKREEEEEDMDEEECSSPQPTLPASIKNELKQQSAATTTASSCTDSGSEHSPMPLIPSIKQTKGKKKGKKDSRLLSDCEAKLADKIKRKKKEGKNGGEDRKLYL